MCSLLDHSFLVVYMGRVIDRMTYVQEFISLQEQRPSTIYLKNTSMQLLHSIQHKKIRGEKSFPSNTDLVLWDNIL